MKLTAIKRELISALSDVCGEYAPYEASQIMRHLYGDCTLRMYDEVERDASTDDIIFRRKAGDPIEYILGTAPFFGLDFEVDRSCLIPQSDTEIVVETALSHLHGGTFADICTGSGCIAVTVAKSSGCHGVATDISSDALMIAGRNAVRHGVADKLVFRNANVFADGTFLDGESFDVIISNPPYIRSDVIPTLSPEVRHEPVSALDGGADGMDFYRRLLDICPPHLNNGGVMIFEIGYDEGDAIVALTSRRRMTCVLIRDYGGNTRCAVIAQQ